ncbi:hypothetical protein AAGO55_22275, partial [Klebsiella pneumoniae]
SAQIREILISESAWEEMTCLFAPSLGHRNIRHTVRYTASNAARFAGIWERNNLLEEKDQKTKNEITD